MIHKLHLNEEPFNMIKNNLKIVEFRLNDEKRQLIKIGDHIVFYKRPLEIETIEVEVIELKHYKNLLEMYKNEFNELKANYKTPEEAVIDTPYYTEEEVSKYGCVAIHFKKL